MTLKDIFHSFRIQVPLADGDDARDSYGAKLPVYGNQEGSHMALNSGGRSIVYENGNGAYRFKGADPFGAITLSVGRSMSNCVRDVSRVARTMTKPPYEVDGKVIILDPFRGEEPFGMMTIGAADRSVRANHNIGGFYRSRGFREPCSPLESMALNISGKQVRYRNNDGGLDTARSLLFGLPDIQSDLRDIELFVAMKAGLSKADPDEVRSYRDRIVALGIDMARWCGFASLSLKENMLVPHPDSNEPQNYVISTVSDGGVGIARVDHGSTKEDGGAKYDEERLFLDTSGVFSGVPASFLLGLWLQDKMEELDRRMYHSHVHWGFDYGRYEHERTGCPVQVPDVKKVRDFMHEARTAFHEGYTGNVKPIPEKRITDIPMLLGEKAVLALLPPALGNILHPGDGGDPPL